MKSIRTFFRILMVSSVVACNVVAQERALSPIDQSATKETINLYRKLHLLSRKGIMFGHQDDLAYGVGWKYQKGRSDVHDVVNDFPAVYGWDLGNIESTANNNNIDGVPFDKMKQYIKEGYSRGGVITISWHAKSPFGNPNGAWDTTHGSVTSVLPGGQNHQLYKEWLDNIAVFIQSLKGSNGEAIPVLFRPFHEHTGSWFWWGRNECTVDEYKTLWRFTVYYLKDLKKLHNLIWVYNAADFESREVLMERYPGDDVVDMISFDSYQYSDPEKDSSFLKLTDQRLTILETVANEKSKLAAIAETGYEAIPYAKWWTEVLLKALNDHNISYVLVWRNHGYNDYMKKMHYYAPYKGQTSEADFIEFYKSEKTLFEKEAATEQLYK